MKHIILGVLALVFLTGCDATINTKVKMSELYNGKSKHLDGLLRVEVPSCTSHKDSRKESKTLFDLKSKVPYALPDAKFKECYTVKFKSYADFTVPIQLSKNKNLSNKHIGIITEGKELLSVHVPKMLQDNIKQLRSNTMGTVNLNVKIQLINDLGKRTPDFMVFSSFINNEPLIAQGGVWLKNNSKPIITLSNVSVEAALNNDKVMVLYKQ